MNLHAELVRVGDRRSVYNTVQPGPDRDVRFSFLQARRTARVSA
jgi:hypothetical protein